MINHDNNNRSSGKKSRSVEATGKAEKLSNETPHKKLLMMFVILLLDLLAFTIILPFLPTILDHYDKQKDDVIYNFLKSGVDIFRKIIQSPENPRWNAVLFGGLIGSLFSMLQFISSPLIGTASDYYGRRKLMLWTTCGTALSYLLWAYSNNFTLFVLSRIVGGMTRGNVSLSTAIVADLLPAEKRGKGMALVGIAFSLGFLIGPMIGAWFAVQSRKESHLSNGPALLALALTIIDILLIALLFKETLVPKNRASRLALGSQSVNPMALFNFKAVNGISREDLLTVRKMGLVYFLFLFFYSGLEFTLTFLTHSRFGFDSMKQGKMFFFIGLTMILLQAGFVRRLKQEKEKRVAVAGLLLVIPSFLTIAFAHTLVPLCIGLLLYSFASATVVSLLTSLVSRLGPASQKGTILGTLRSLGALARALGPAIASSVYWLAGPEVCYTLGGLALVVPFLLFKRLADGQHKKAK